MAKSTFHDFVEINNEGVRLIKSLRYDDASACFRKSLELLNQKETHQDEQNIEDCASNSSSTTSSAGSKSMHAPTCFGSRAQHSTSFAHLTNTGTILQDLFVLDDEDLGHSSAGRTTTFIFQNLAFVRADLAEGKHLQISDGPLLTITLNNMALSYHLAALEKQCKNRLEYAIFYYELSYQLLLRDQEVPLFQVMTVLNNLGHVHKLLGNDELSGNCFQLLLAAAVHIQNSGQSHRISHWDSFISNILDVFLISTDGIAVMPAAGAA
jgi:tetratricopeptide (TPR) repeat protein